LFKTEAWLQIMLGQGIVPEHYHPMADVLTDDQLKQFLGDLKRVIEHKAATFSDHRCYIQKHCAAA
jgi:tryptophan halogenase